MGHSTRAHGFAADFEPLLDQALAHAARQLAERRGRLSPYAMIVDEGEPCIRRFWDGDPDRSLSLALAFAGLGGYEFWAVAWEGELETDEGRVEALFVRAGSGVAPGGVLIARPLERSGVGPHMALESLGVPLVLACDEQV